jgi:hypothetical protein
LVIRPAAWGHTDARRACSILLTSMASAMTTIGPATSQTMPDPAGRRARQDSGSSASAGKPKNAAAITMMAQTGGSELMRRLALDRLPRDGSGTKRNWRRQSVLPFR